MNPVSARKPLPTSAYLVYQSRCRVLWFQYTCDAPPLTCCPVHASARSGRFGVCVSLYSHCPVMTSDADGRHWKSGPTTRLCEPPSVASRSVINTPTKDRPMSFFARPMNTFDG